MQTKPDYLDRLLDEASAKAGSDYALAKLLDVNRATVSQYRSGKRTCPVADVALMAEIAGLKPEEWIARAVVKQYEGSAKGDKLYRALGKFIAATGAAIASSGASALPIFSHSATQAVDYFIRCILC
jgi:hypothetical protein